MHPPYASFLLGRIKNCFFEEKRNRISTKIFMKWKLMKLNTIKNEEFLNSSGKMLKYQWIQKNLKFHKTAKRHDFVWKFLNIPFFPTYKLFDLRQTTSYKPIWFVHCMRCDIKHMNIEHGSDTSKHIQHRRKKTFFFCGRKYIFRFCTYKAANETQQRKIVFYLWEQRISEFTVYNQNNICVSDISKQHEQRKREENSLVRKFWLADFEKWRVEYADSKKTRIYRIQRDGCAAFTIQLSDAKVVQNYVSILFYEFEISRFINERIYKSEATIFFVYAYAYAYTYKSQHKNRK